MKILTANRLSDGEAVWLAAAENPQEALGLPPGCQTPRP